MKKVLNIIGYISLLTIPYLLIVFYFEFYNLVKVLLLISLAIIIFFQVNNYIKTKSKNIGIRILTTIIAICICSFIIYNIYGAIKNIEARIIAKKIEKITFENHEINGQDIEKNIKFINSKSLIYKGSEDAKIIYKDGTIEETKVSGPGFFIIQIKNGKYYIKE